MHRRVRKQAASRASPESRCSSRYPLGGQTPRRWWPCWLHPPLLWWHWGCSRRPWQHPQHSVPAHPRWYFSLSWKMTQGGGRSSSILSLPGDAILPMSVQHVLCTCYSVPRAQLRDRSHCKSGFDLVYGFWMALWPWSSPPPCSWVLASPVRTLPDTQSTHDVWTSAARHLLFQLLCQLL